MDEILEHVREQIEEISGELYYFSDTRLPYLDIYDKSTVGWEWVCRVEPLKEMDNYQITPHSSSRSPRKVGKDNLLMEVLKELIINDE